MKNKPTLDEFAEYVEEAADELIGRVSEGFIDSLDCDEDKLFEQTVDNLRYVYGYIDACTGTTPRWVTNYWDSPAVKSIVKDFEERAYDADGF